MNLSIHLNIITGIMLGFEHVALDNSQFIVIDILFVRLTFEFYGE